MSLGGGGFGGGGLPSASEVLQLWGGKLQESSVAKPSPPIVMRHDGTAPHEYALVALGPQGTRSPTSAPTKANGRASLEWDSAVGADSYIVLRDGREIAGPLRIEGSRKQWRDEVAN